MRVLGIICEYNPFHNGHLHHINEARKKTGADYVVCVMSGNFVQRGEPAILNKWTRTKMALQNGVDIVIELPLPFSISSASYFAMSGIKILESLNIVTDFCFGAECHNIESLRNLAHVLNIEPPNYQSLLKNMLSLGHSYPKARQLALSQYLEDDSICDILLHPNNILGIEYLKALEALNSDITPSIIQRTNNYNSLELKDTLVSSSAIRNALFNKSFDMDYLCKFMPYNCASLLLGDIDSGIAPISFEKFDNILLSKLRLMSKAQMAQINYISEGFENRLKDLSNKACSVLDLAFKLHTKRYTDTRVYRILLNTLFGITKAQFDAFCESLYIRILGVNSNGKKLLSDISSKASLPIILNSSDALNLKDSTLKQMFDLECLSTNLYILAYDNPKFKMANCDLTRGLIVV